MKCDDLERMVDPYLDGEFGTTEATEIELHLAGCEPCRRRAAMERALHARLRQVGEVSAPDRLRMAILDNLDGLEAVDGRPRPGRFTDWRGWRVLSLGAAVVLLVGLAAAGVATRYDRDHDAHVTGDLSAVLDRSLGRTSTERVVAETVDWHAQRLPMEVTGPRSEDVGIWFNDKVDFPVRVPSFRRPDVALLGGRLAKVGDQKAALVTMAVRQRKLSVMVFPAQYPRQSRAQLSRRAPHAMELRQAAGYNVVILRSGDVNYSFVSDLPTHELRQLVGSAQLE